MSSRRPCDAVATPEEADALAGMFRFEQIASVDAPLTRRDRVARRGEPDHERAMALLAYTNDWDVFVNAHSEKIPLISVMKEFGKLPGSPDYAGDYVAVLAFFGPGFDMVETYRSAFTYRNRLNASRAVREISLVLPRSTGWRRPGCKLTLRLEKSRAEEDLKKRLIEDVLLKVGDTSLDATLRGPRGRLDALEFFEYTVASIAYELGHLATALTEPLVLWRGLNVAPGTDIVRVLERDLHRFTSTSRLTLSRVGFAQPQLGGRGAPLACIAAMPSCPFTSGWVA